jgi:sulfur transfer protein SufE
MNRLRSRATVAVLVKASGKTAQEIHALKKGKTWQEVVSSLGLSWTNLLPSIQQGVKARETALSNRRFLVRFLARKSSKTVKEIQALKKQDKNWPAVEASLGITKQEVGQALAAHRLNEAKRRVAKGVFTSLLAKTSGKTAQEIRALKLQDKKWQNVVQSLGLDWTSIAKTARQEIKARETAQLRINFLVGYLARATGKKPAQIRALKTKSNTWIQIGQSLGL